MAAKVFNSPLLRRPSTQITSLPDYLVPAFYTTSSRRHFSSNPRCASRIGSAPISIPPEVNLKLLEPTSPKAITRVEPPRTLEVEGPLGKLILKVAPYLAFEYDETTRKASLTVRDRNEREQRQMWGTTRANLNNYVMGVSEGHTAILRLVGVGYRATIEPSAVTVQPEYPGQQFVSLKVGYSHPIELGIPLGVKATAPLPTRVLLEGPDKEVVMQLAANIRKWRKPEPYKGKGIFVNGETIKLKAKKIK